jgi:hypothetical protein
MERGDGNCAASVSQQKTVKSAGRAWSGLMQRGDGNCAAAVSQQKTLKSAGSAGRAVLQLRCSRWFLVAQCSFRPVIRKWAPRLSYRL